MAQDFTQNEGIDYHETFSQVSRKNALRIVMALGAHFYMKLHQIDMKMEFSNENLKEEIYVNHLEGFCNSKGNYLVCKLRKSIYGLKQTSQQKCDYFVGLFLNIVDQYIYHTISEKKIIFFLCYM